MNKDVKKIIKEVNPQFRLDFHKKYIYSIIVYIKIQINSPLILYLK